MKRLTIGIFTCDAYKDLWETNVKLLKKNFPLELGFDVVFVTDKRPSKTSENMAGYQFIWNDNPNDFLDKLSVFLKYCKTDYFLFLLDDYFFTRKIEAKTILNFLNFVNCRDVDYLKLNIKSRLRLSKRFIFNKKKFASLRTSKPYSIDLYPSIWNKQFVEETIRKWPFNERTIWNYEGKFYRLGEIIDLSNCYCYCGKDFYFEDVVRKGKIIRKAYKTLLRQYDCDLSINRPLMNRKEYICDKIIPFISRLLPEKIKRKIKDKQEKKGKRFYS